MIKVQLLIPYLIVSPLQRILEIEDQLVVLLELRQIAEEETDEEAIRSIDGSIGELLTDFNAIKHLAN